MALHPSASDRERPRVSPIVMPITPPENGMVHDAYGIQPSNA
jgi:hypothetical protein